MLVDQDSSRISHGISEDLFRNGPAVEIAALNLRRKYDLNVGDQVLKALIEDTIDLGNGKERIDDEMNRGKAWMFQLVRRLKKHFVTNDRKGRGRTLAPLALLFIEILSMHVELDWGSVDWRDEESVLLAFEAEWSKVKFAEDERLVTAAFDQARQSPFFVSQGALTKVVLVASCLQKANGGKEFFLPINEEIAKLFDFSKMTLSNAISTAIERGYFHVLKGHIPNKEARHLSLQTDHPDLVLWLRT